MKIALDYIANPKFVYINVIIILVLQLAMQLILKQELVTKLFHLPSQLAKTQIEEAKDDMLIPYKSSTDCAEYLQISSVASAKFSTNK